MGGVDFGHLGQPRNAVTVDGKLVGLPVPEAGRQRLAPAVVTDALGEFAFEAESAEGPILHDPCRTIHWQLSTAGMPVGAEPVTQEAVARVAEHTGLVFVFDGYTDEQATFDGPLSMHGDAWEYAPMVIGWGTGDIQGLAAAGAEPCEGAT